jgi:hypothetical protein
MPAQAQAREPFGEPAGGLVGIKHDVVQRQSRQHYRGDQRLGQLQLGLIACGATATLGLPEPKADGNAPVSIYTRRHEGILHPVCWRVATTVYRMSASLALVGC